MHPVASSSVPPPYTDLERGQYEGKVAATMASPTDNRDNHRDNLELRTASETEVSIYLHESQITSRIISVNLTLQLAAVAVILWLVYMITVSFCGRSESH